ncbi:hypothetical protein EV175_000132 [Coemansia sp. RSA 1933]|nr:hypothetical protein EV175_000132 [Coemansia sp. RSA 1933]
MGLFSFFKKEENFEEVLANLEQEIRQAEKVREKAVRRAAWWAHNWVFYTGIAWAAYAAGVALYVWPERHGAQAGDFLIHATAVLVIPLVIYYGKVCISGIGNQVVDRHNTKIRTLRKELKEKLDELKKKTAFDSTKSLIDRYSLSNKAPGNEGAEGSKSVAVMQGKRGRHAVQLQLQQRQQQQELNNRRRTMESFKTPDTQDSTATRQSAGTPETEAASPLAAKTMQRQGPYQGTTLGPVPQISGQLGVGQTGVVRMSPRKSSAHQQGAASIGGAGGAMGSGAVSRPWLDKLVDQLVGDVGSEEDKYALICRHCYAHNGLVLEEEIEDIQYACPKCGSFNPSVRALRARSQDDILQRKKPIARQSDSFFESPDAHGESTSGVENESFVSEDAPQQHDDEGDDLASGDDEKREEGQEERSSHSGMEEGEDNDDVAGSRQTEADTQDMLRTPTPKSKQTKDIVVSEHVTTRKRRNKNKRT